MNRLHESAGKHAAYQNSCQSKIRIQVADERAVGIDGFNILRVSISTHVVGRIEVLQPHQPRQLPDGASMQIVLMVREHFEVVINNFRWGIEQPPGDSLSYIASL